MMKDKEDGYVAGADKPMTETGPIGTASPATQDGSAAGDGNPDAEAVKHAIIRLERIADGFHEGTVMDEYARICSDVTTLSTAPDVIGADRYLRYGCDEALGLMSMAMAARATDGGDPEDHRSESMLLHTMIVKELILEAEGELPQGLLEDLKTRNGWIARSPGRV